MFTLPGLLLIAEPNSIWPVCSFLIIRPSHHTGGKCLLSLFSMSWWLTFPQMLPYFCQTPINCCFKCAHTSGNLAALPSLEASLPGRLTWCSDLNSCSLGLWYKLLPWGFSWPLCWARCPTSCAPCFPLSWFTCLFCWSTSSSISLRKDIQKVKI